MTIRAKDVVFSPLATEGAVEQIVRRLGEAIGSGVLAAGERLPAEPELAAQLAVAPMTLRTALAILREAGVVETRRGRGGGSFVRLDPPAVLVPGVEPPTRVQLRELTDWRRAISGEAAALAAERVTGSSLTALRAADAATVAAVADVVAFRLCDARFHLAVAEASGSRRLVAAEAALQTEVGDVLRFVPGPRLARAASQAGHGPIVEAIGRSHSSVARGATERHVESTFDWFVGLRLGRLS